MYKAKTGGSTNSKSGVRYEWNAGDTVDAGKGELDHVGSLEWVEDSEKRSENDLPTMQNTKKEIQQYMDKNGIEYVSNDTKRELLDKIIENA